MAHYINKGSKIYACFVDATKAFDRINIGKLFKILLHKNIDITFTRLLFDMYQRQEVTARWKNTESFCFTPQNGVRQGGILSPLLFNLYIDKLINELKNRGIGCYMGHYFGGAIAYADDLTLLSPSRSGLQCMLNMCESFSKEYDVKFNSKKTQGIIFNKNSNYVNYIAETNKVTLCNEEIDWVECVTYLGTIIKYNLDDKDDILSKKCDFIYSVNNIINNFKGVSSALLNLLFKSYCYSFYGSQTWNLYNNALCSLYTAFNIGLRRIWKLPYNTHKYIIFDISGTSSLQDIMVNRFVKCLNNMIIGPNNLVNYIGKRAVSQSTGPVGHSLNYIRERYNIKWNHMKSCFNIININNYLDITKDVICKTVKELCNVRDGVLYIENFNAGSIDASFVKDYLDWLCTL